MTYRLDTIGGSDTFMTNASLYGYFGRAEYLIVGGTSTAQYWGMMSWDMTTLPTLASGDKAELMLFGLNFSGQSPTDMQLGMSATAWVDTDPWKIFSWYSTVNKIVPATPYNKWPNRQQRHSTLTHQQHRQVHSTCLGRHLCDRG